MTMQTAFAATSPILPTHVVECVRNRIAGFAVEALIDEARLTPKPGLVDGRGPGAHHDLSLPLLLRSAQVLRPHFTAMAEAAEFLPTGLVLRERLGALGRDAELEMLQVTGGANTHRGAIWSLGLLVAAAAQQPGANADRICHTAGSIAALLDRHALAADSHGTRARRLFGATGARGEAAAGFPHLRLHALPALRKARADGHCEQTSRVHTLLALMAVVPDTCLLHRGGPAALAEAQRGAAHALAQGGLATAAGQRAVAELDRTLLRLWASPGGSADLLAATLFLDQVTAATGPTSTRTPHD